MFAFRYRCCNFFFMSDATLDFLVSDEPLRKVLEISARHSWQSQTDLSMHKAAAQMGITKR